MVQLITWPADLRAPHEIGAPVGSPGLSLAALQTQLLGKSDCPATLTARQPWLPGNPGCPATPAARQP